MIEQGEVERFEQLFRGNKRSFGQYLPNAHVKSFSINEEYTSEHIRSHLDGLVGVGISPICDDDTCVWAAIDIDVHGPNAQPVDIERVEQAVEKHKLPLVVCRTKSGGVHTYLFLKAPTEAARVRSTLSRWANTLGFPTAEVFPKQITLAERPTDTERPKGNWLNLPYFNATQTDRWCIDGGKQVTFDYFLSLAESKRVDLHDYEHGADVDYINGPPCLQEMIKARIEEGGRNTAVFQAAVYLKRAFTSDWKAKVIEFNQMALTRPLPQQELRTILGSVHKRDYQYKCREEPCRSMCNKDLCKKRDFGITDKDASANEVPLIDKVEKVVATPIRWDLTLKGKTISVNTAELFNYEVVRQRVGEMLHIVLPRMKAQDWDLYLHEIMGKVEVREEMTLEGVIFARLCEFLKRCNHEKGTDEAERREDLKRGMPALICLSRTSFNKENKLEETGKEWYYAFKMMDFLDWMRRKKVMPCQDHQLYSYLLKILGEEAKRSKVRVGNSQVGNVWCVSEQKVEDEKTPEKQFQTEY